MPKFSSLQMELEMAKFLSQEAVLRLPGLLKGSYRPLQILNLQEEIKSKTRAAELKANISNQIDQAEV